MKSKILILLMLVPFALMAEGKLEVVGGLELNWGTVKRSQGLLEKNVKLKNIGDTELVVHGIKPGCSCTKFDLEKRSLKPNETGNLKVVVDTKDDFGPKRKLLQIFTSSKTQQEHNLALVYNVDTPIYFEPNNVMLDNMIPGQTAFGSMEIYNTTAKSIQITDVVKEIPSMEVNFPNGKTIPAKGKIEIEVKLLLSYKSNVYSKLTLKTNNKEVPQFEFHAIGMLQK